MAGFYDDTSGSGLSTAPLVTNAATQTGFTTTIANAGVQVGFYPVDAIPTLLQSPFSGQLAKTNAHVRSVSLDAPITGLITISNFPPFPATRALSGTLNVGNWPTARAIIGPRCVEVSSSVF